jgi:predicted CoA-substrate-specific enzyme activase
MSTARVTGITGTLPIEVLLAAGRRVLDLNNAFVTAPSPLGLLDDAHRLGLAPTQCAWTRGIVGAAVSPGLVDEVVVVARGDCTQNRMLLDLLPALGGPPTLAFEFPPERGDVVRLRREIDRFAAALGVDVAAVQAAYDGLRPLRNALAELDRLTWQEGTVTGHENALLLVSATDLGGDRVTYEARVAALLQQAAQRSPRDWSHRVAVFGVPPIVPDLHDHLETRGAKVVLNETQRDFAQLEPADDPAVQYAERYAYAYSIHDRLAAFLPELRRRRVDGVVVYQQSFCHHNAETEAVTRALAGVPLVVLEADGPAGLDAAARLRLDAFLAALPRRTTRRAVRSPGPVVGLDVGSRRTKVLVTDAGREVRRALLETVPFLRTLRRDPSGGLALDADALAAVLQHDVLPTGARVVSTGYGRYSVRLSGTQVVPEVQAHAAGAARQSGLDDFVLVDLGGQDVKVMQVAGGRVVDFALNDKCAAGSGRYLENMARLLDVPLEAFLAEWEDPAPVAATCATFGETEVISRLVEGHEVARIAAGVNHAVVQRLLPVLARFPAAPLLLAGGASGAGIARLLADRTSRDVRALPEPVFNGALGCTLLSEE